MHGWMHACMQACLSPPLAFEWRRRQKVGNFHSFVLLLRKVVVSALIKYIFNALCSSAFFQVGIRAKKTHARYIRGVSIWWAPVIAIDRKSISSNWSISGGISDVERFPFDVGSKIKNEGELYLTRKWFLWTVIESLERNDKKFWSIFCQFQWWYNLRFFTHKLSDIGQKSIGGRLFRMFFTLSTRLLNLNGGNANKPFVPYAAPSYMMLKIHRD